MTPLMKRFLVPALLVVAGCKVGHNGSANDASYRPTLHYVVTTASATLGGVTIPLLDNRDLDSFQIQTASTLSSGKGLVYVVVRTAAGLPVLGATVEAVNSTGLATGGVFYRTATGFNGAAGTDSTGALVIMNLDPGVHNIRATTGASGNCYINVEADGATSLSLVVGAPVGAFNLYGQTKTFVNPAGGAAEAAVDLRGIGIGAPLSLVTSDGAGTYATVGSPLAVKGSNLLLVRASKSGATYVDAYTYLDTATATAGVAHDLYSVLASNLAPGGEIVATGVTLSAGKGILRGRVKDGGGFGSGFTVAATNLSGTSAAVAYGVGPNGVPSNTATATDSTGVFYVYNADPGTVFLRASTSSKAGSTLAEAFADSVTFLDDDMLQTAGITQTNVIVNGTVLSFFFGAVDEATVTFLGPALSDSSSFGGDVSVNGVPSNSSLVIRTTK